ncbi:MAG: aldo/keto reductase, partial [Gammaproteobacteria bacterium]
MTSESNLRSRRDILKTGVATGMIASLPVWVSAQVAGAAAEVITRPIPSTGELIPVSGLGTNQFGRADYDAVKNVLARMHAMGGTVIDTAAGYGASEEVIGRALGELNLRDEMFIATKFNAPGGRG